MLGKENEINSKNGHDVYGFPIFPLSHHPPESSYFLLGTKGIPDILGETPFSCSQGINWKPTTRL